MVSPVSNAEFLLSNDVVSSVPQAKALSAFLFRKPQQRVYVRTGAGLPPEFKSALDSLITSHKIVVFMKGTKQFPQCGFSHTVVQILNTLEAPFETVDILETEMLRQGMKEYSQWPTFPQVYIDGEFYGGCDIMIESYQSGSLQETIEKTMNS